MVESSLVLLLYISLERKHMVSRKPIFEEEKLVVFLVINIALASSNLY